MTAAQDELTAATESVRTTAAAKADLTAIALNGDTANPSVVGPKLAQVGLLNELGLKTVGPEGEDNTYWGELS